MIDEEIDAQADAWLKRMQATADKRAAEWEAKPQAEKDAILKEQNDREFQFKMQEIDYRMTSGNAPSRQLKTRGLDRAGEWGATEAKIKAKLKSGFLISLIGIRGAGKTQLAVEVMRHVAEKNSVHYCTAMGFFMRVKATYKNDSSETELEIVDELCGQALLVIDEIGQRSETEWENRLLYELLNRRYNASKDTLIISNQELPALEASLGPSIVSRMQETGGIIECKWKSYRV